MTKLAVCYTDTITIRFFSTLFRIIDPLWFHLVVSASTTQTLTECCTIETREQVSQFTLISNLSKTMYDNYSVLSPNINSEKQ